MVGVKRQATKTSLDVPTAWTIDKQTCLYELVRNMTQGHIQANTSYKSDAPHCTRKATRQNSTSRYMSGQVGEKYLQFYSISVSIESWILWRSKVTWSTGTWCNIKYEPAYHERREISTYDNRKRNNMSVYAEIKLEENITFSWMGFSKRLPFYPVSINLHFTAFELLTYHQLPA